MLSRDANKICVRLFARRWREATTRGTCALLSLFACSGCGSASYELETAPVSGRVTYNGMPLSSGYVFVLPDKGRMAKGAIQSDGTFTLGTYDKSDGAQVGTHSVIVTEVPGDEHNGPKNITAARIRLPARYAVAASSGLTINVRPGTNNTAEFNLTSSDK